MNARLSMGKLSGVSCPVCTLICPFHGARFDVTSGKKAMGYLEHAGELMSCIKTYDQQTYEVEVEGNRIKIRI